MAHTYSSLKNEIYSDENEVTGLELQFPTKACYNPFLPILESAWILSFSDEIREKKRIKRTGISDSIGNISGSYSTGDSSIGYGSISNSSSTSSVNSLPKLHFRDHIWTYTQRYHAAEAVEEAAAAMISAVEGGAEEDGCADGMRLVQLLIACAEAVACRDKSHASVLLSELRANALVFGSSFQRVASCFVQGLADRISLIQPLGAVGFVAPMNIMDAASEKKEEALHLVYEICPHIQFGHFVANSTILEAFEVLANQFRRLRITGVGLCTERFQIIGDELETYARNLGINLEFSVVNKNLENLRPDDIRVYEGEVLVVNSILQLHCVVKESRGALNSVLQMIHELSPKVLVLLEQDSSHNGPFFLGRFMEALHYYSAIFDSLDAMLPKYDTRRAKMEQFYFAEEIKNIVSCEGPARVERHERVDQWRRRMSRAGFQAAPIKMMPQAKQWLHKNKVCEGYIIMEEKGCLVLGWNSKPIVAASCWKC
ncbi:GRAS family transcription factor [Quillaja saponaria]|uniref:GRAS family transcription factor n=1 Tax=Quillaja saponaria TaxID=32244 RepID=A0AAD7KU16_QUISA|nr:GRAS family transcription factor [Quillaja saponaria]